MEANNWHHGLFSGICGADSCSLCLGAWFCSCFLHGRTAQRLEQFPSEETPSDLMNGQCCLFYAAGCCSLAGIVAMFQRGDVRVKFGIHGDGFTDCLAACCCTPCALAQMEVEVKGRAKLAREMGGKAAGYSQVPGGMVYEQQQPMQYQQQPPVHNGHPHQEPHKN